MEIDRRGTMDRTEFTMANTLSDGARTDAVGGLNSTNFHPGEIDTGTIDFRNMTVGVLDEPIDPAIYTKAASINYDLIDPIHMLGIDSTKVISRLKKESLRPKRP